MGDLSKPDRFIVFTEEPKLFNLLMVQFDYSSLNLLPLAWGVLMFINQKFTSPPAATKEAAQTQKMMRVMTLLFPLFLYAAPSGLMLYITASTIAGIADSYFVRKHIKREEEAGTLLTPREKKQKSTGDDKPKKEGFFARAMRMAEERVEQQKGGQAKGRSGGRSGGGSGGGAPGGRRQAAAERALHASRDKAAKQKPKKGKKRRK